MILHHSFSPCVDRRVLLGLNKAFSNQFHKVIIVGTLTNGPSVSGPVEARDMLRGHARATKLLTYQFMHIS